MKTTSPGAPALGARCGGVLLDPMRLQAGTVRRW